MKLTISGYSTALFATHYFVDELALLFDCGDGVTAHLKQKSRKVKNVFISHADRDHMAGLVQFSQLNSRGGNEQDSSQRLPVVYYPESCGSFPAMHAFCEKFDPQNPPGPWKGIKAGQPIAIRPNVVVKGIENEHQPKEEGQTKSLSYHVISTKKKLKEEFKCLPGEEIGRLMKEQGEDALTREEKETILSFSGDTPVDWDGRWDQTKVLIHEATFLKREDVSNFEVSGSKHSMLNEVMQMASELKLEALILGHFSTRYAQTHIENAIRTHCRQLNIDFPVYRILPGEFTWDILAQPPVNE